ncbi:hypothetical protein AB0I60_34435 [Actinosynnema sp. NPDC050436]|uniref:hypothetical protein n=1 Tax=Actinosynnema sp. NPDC050436 TaxID=3155659 RepID=UPI003408F664
MTTYTLNIDPGDAGAAAIKNLKQFVTVAKASDGGTSAGTDVPNVNWLAFSPWDKNAVVWEEKYALFATQTVIEHGKQIIQGSSQDDPTLGREYAFDDGTWTDNGSGTQGRFQIRNENGKTTNFGLALEVSVQGGPMQYSPLAINEVGNNEHVSYEPLEIVYVYLNSNGNNGVIWDVSSDALEVTLTPANPSAEIGFDIDNNTFFLQKSAKPLEGAH